MPAMNPGFFLLPEERSSVYRWIPLILGHTRICEDDVYTFEGRGYAPGEYFIPVLDQNGLDSLIIRLTVG